jgi:uncharacterized membrane protein
MNQQYRAAAFVGSVLLLMAPYLAFVLYYSQRFPAHHWPSWFTETIAVWFIANFLLLMLLAKRIFKRQVVEPQVARRASKIAQIVVSYLLIVWSVLFFYGVRGTMRGEVPISRAIPAGAVLLFFITLFGWSLYRSRRGKA